MLICVYQDFLKSSVNDVLEKGLSACLYYVWMNNVNEAHGFFFCAANYATIRDDIYSWNAR